LQPKVLYLSHYPLLAGHPRGSKMYDSMRRRYYWSRMTNDVFQTAKDCRLCAEARGTRYKTQKPMKLFTATKPLDFIAMDLLGPFQPTKNGSTDILVITDRFSKLAQVTPLTSTTAPAVANAFIDNWVIPYGLPVSMLTDNGPQFVAKFFEAVCLTLGLKHVTTTAYHPQTNGQTERYNQTLATRLRIFTGRHTTDWDRLIQPLTYAYNSQVHRTTNETPFSLVLTRPPPDIITREDFPRPDENDMNPEEARLKVMKRKQTLVEKAAARSKDQQAKYKHYHDRKVRSPIHVKVGDDVFVNLPPAGGQTPAERLAEEPQGKLRKKTTGTYKVLEVRDTTVRVAKDGIEDTISIDRVTIAPPPLDPTTLKPVASDLPETTNSTPDVQSSTSPPATSTPDPTESQEAQGLPPTTLSTLPPTTAERKDEDNADPDETTQTSAEYVVDRLIARRDTDDGPYYKVRWFNFGKDDDTWEPADNIPANMRHRFDEQQAKKSERRRRGRRR